MFGQMIGPRKRFSANITRQFFMLVVQFLMLQQMIFPHETFSANIARERFIFRMRAHVPFQMIRSAEVFTAHVTFMDLQFCRSETICFFYVDHTLRPGCASFACLSSKLIRSKKSLQTGHGYSPMSSSSTIFAFFLIPLLPVNLNINSAKVLVLKNIT